MMQKRIETERVFAGHDAIDYDTVGGRNRYDVLLRQLLKIGERFVFSHEIAHAGDE